jgi:hypothetical protein
MSDFPEVENFDLYDSGETEERKRIPAEQKYDESTFVSSGEIGFDTLDEVDRFNAYKEDIQLPSKEFIPLFPQEYISPLKNVEYSNTQDNIEEEYRVENDESEEFVPQLDKSSKKISKSKTECAKKSDSKKEDPKKNAPGLHRDRCLKCSKDLLKTLKKDTSLAALEEIFKNFEAPSKKRFGFMIKIFRENAAHFSEYVKFVEYMKKKFQPDWKDKKTWAKLKEFCTIREYSNAGKIFKQIMYAIIERNDNSEIDLWISKFRGNINTKEYIVSDQYKKDFEHHMRQ